MGAENPAKPTPQEIEALIAEMARNGEGADQRWALNILRREQEAETVIPPPLQDHEVIEYLIRVMRPSGPEPCMIAFRRCWPHKGMDGIKKRPVISDRDISPEQMLAVEKITTLKQFYKAFPEIKPRGGVPKGYPSGRGLVEKRDWCRRAAALILADREQNQIDGSIAQEGKDAPTTAST